ncbi:MULTISPECIES: DUF6732 family protein [Halocynthiibacter]|uniref:Uncharacterized protein n=1 Tax=Halocynthiibacter halioticoli TaxID=2986804 RepID=A0AAE3IYH4_9RHOB|nr:MULTISPECIES: DUF6732 family protein [Halocynthiibacter]MCV6823238.1 hypothetical protein [Halocynthiibacter halioticoli]MCW4056239.1 hypothetical protein [Halocynthiibacter sp. SDUM655004]
MSYLKSSFVAAAGAIVASPVLAHPGHVAESHGHTHWLAIAAVGAAVVVGFWAVTRRTKDETLKAEAEAKPSDKDDLQEA